ncbi:hypothetical protein NK638_00235 [Psychrobacter sp. A3]|uniref:hypothetical protein n=1 Tax=Psychrobacter sp. A3 TaxID=2992754 RepID=UPI00237A953B|nr:hypothetical protein [Psychrobacter sp. A3]MDE0489987.1 hypothetical protein [Psychrobacter sp. A3]
MKSINEISVSSRTFEALNNALHQPYINALNAASAKGYDMRQVLTTDISKVSLSVSAAA